MSQLCHPFLQELAQWSSLAPVEGEKLPFPVGSVAVRQARAATLRAQRAEQQLTAAVAERDALTRQVEELRPPELQQPDRPGGQFFFSLCVRMLGCRHLALHAGRCESTAKQACLSLSAHFPSLAQTHTLAVCQDLLIIILVAYFEHKPLLI